MTKLEDIFLLRPACLFSLNYLIFIYVRQAANSRLMRYVWDTSSRVPKQRDICNFEWNKWKLMPSKLETSQTSWSVVMIYSCPRLSIQHLCVCEFQISPGSESSGKNSHIVSGNRCKSCVHAPLNVLMSRSHHLPLHLTPITPTIFFKKSNWHEDPTENQCCVHIRPKQYLKLELVSQIVVCWN